MNIFRKTSPIRHISNNMVDKDVQLLLLPLNLSQYIMFCPKYRFKNDLITPNTLFSNIVSLLFTLFFIFLYILCTYLEHFNIIDLHYSTFVMISAQFVCIFFCVGFAMNFVNGITQTSNNIQFVLVFQKIHEIFNKDNVKHFVLMSSILVVLALSFYLILLAYFFTQLGLKFYSSYGMLVVVFDLNIVYATQLIKLLESKVKQWNSHVLNSQEWDPHQENVTNKQFQAFLDILACYNIHKISFQPLVRTTNISEHGVPTFNPENRTVLDENNNNVLEFDLDS